MREIIAQLPAGIRRRVFRARDDKRCTFFDFQEKKYAYDHITDALYIVESKFSGERLASFNLAGYFDGYYVTSAERVESVQQPQTPVEKEPTRASIHSVERIMERSPIFKDEDKAREYILKAIEEAQKAGTWFPVTDGSTMYIWKQYVFAMRQTTVCTTLRRTKMFDLALIIYKDTKFPVPERLITKKTKEWILG
jgi:hypothetical protein